MADMSTMKEDSNNTPSLVFRIREHLSHTWTDELVGFSIDPAETRPPKAVQDETGNVIPCQVISNSEMCRVYFTVDRLPALSERSFTLITNGKPQHHDSPLSVRVTDGTVEISNGLISVRIPGSTAKPSPAPPPVVSVRRGKGPWIGQGRMTFSRHLELQRVESREITSGPLWVEWEIRYICADTQVYTVRLKLYAAKPYVEITEKSELCRDSHWEFSVREGLMPDHTWTHPRQVDADNPKRLRAIDYAALNEQENLGAIQLPVYGGIWIANDYYYFAFLNRRTGKRDLVAVAGVNGGMWTYPYENQIDIEIAPDKDAFYRFSIKAGVRRWLLLVADREEVTATEPFYVNSIHTAVKKYETPLDKVKEYVLHWDETGRKQRPLALADREQLKHAQTLAREYAPLKQYVASLDPDLPGDYTYYHAQTHRTLGADCRNDPAVLYVVADDQCERRKQALFLKDVVTKGLENRRNALLSYGGHTDGNVSPINVGRGLRPWSVLYDFAASEGVFTEAEQRLVRATFALFCYKIFDPDYWPADALTLRDDHPRSAHRTHWFPMRHSDSCFYNIDNLPHNFHGDLWTAAGCVAMTFPNHPESGNWITRTLHFWENELTYWIFPEGAWIESTGYTLNSMKDYVIYCRMLANSGIKNYFADERFKKVFRFFAETLLPTDKRIDAASPPVLGDASYPNRNSYVLGWMAGLAREEDPDYAAILNCAWKRTGEKLVEPGRWGLNFCDFLFLDPRGPQKGLTGLSSKWYRGLGALLRHAHGTSEEIYMFVKSGPIYSHFHEPEGTFQLWWDGVPLCDEYGVQYAPGTRLASSHNCIEVPGLSNVYNKGDISTFITTPSFDYMVVERPILNAYIAEPMLIYGHKGEMGPAGWHRRHVFLAKPFYVAMYDELDCPHPTKYHLNIKADGYKQYGNLVHYDGRFGVDMEFAALDLGSRTIRHGEFNVEPRDRLLGKKECDCPSAFYHQLQLTIESAPYEDYATLLVPHKPGIRISIANEHASGEVRIAIGEHKERIFLFPRRRHFETEEVVYNGMAGAIREDERQLLFLQAKGNLIGMKGRLVIKGYGPFMASLDQKNALEIRAFWGTQWLTLYGMRFSKASCHSGEVPLQKTADNGYKIYVGNVENVLHVR